MGSIKMNGRNDNVTLVERLSERSFSKRAFHCFTICNKLELL